MSDVFNSEGPGESAHQQPDPSAVSGDDAVKPNNGAEGVADPYAVDAEVAAAMNAMDDSELSALCGPTAASPSEAPTPSDSIAAGSKLVGKVAGISGEDIFVEFNAKSQGVIAVSQFDASQVPKIGDRIEVVVERYDNDAGLLILNKEGAILRATWETLSKGMLVQGRVTGLIKGGLEVSVNGLRAFMPTSHTDLQQLKDISILLNEVVQCVVLDVDRRAKNILVSRRKFQEKERAEKRETLLAELAKGQIRHGVVGTITDFGAFIDLGGVDGLLHIRELSWGTVEKVTDVLSPGQEVDVAVLKIDKERNRISLGLKQALPDPWMGVEERYPVGSTVTAKVLRLANFGAFAELETGVEALIPLSEMGWSHVVSSSDAVSVGDEVEAAVIRVEPSKRRIALSLKQAQPDPWDVVLSGFEVQSMVSGTVTRVADFGAFVEVATGVEGLIHISQLSDQRVRACSDVVKVGQQVETRVLGVDRENRRISLSMKSSPSNAAESGAGAKSVDLPKPKRSRKKALRGGLSSHFEW